MEPNKATAAGCLILLLCVAAIIAVPLYRAHKQDVAVRPYLPMIGQAVPAVTQDPATLQARQAWEARHGKPETLPGTSPQLWRVYLPTSNITLTIDKATDKIISVQHGRR